jgi:phosphoketolase
MEKTERIKEGVMPDSLPEQVKAIDPYWRAANYLSVGQIYLYEIAVALAIAWKAYDNRPGPESAV